ncbi:MAG: division/cell wall cluster transcriptional repressor MraZ [Lachnospiraceae bacterium]|nr:division/cell wall cluster transcriptional repressor MraZ [Lachnospiraceae bacterium]
MFMGEHGHNIDEKGRVIMPAKFREQLGDNFVLTKGLDGCLFVYPMTEWEEIQRRFRETSLASKDARIFSRFFFGSASEVEIDKQGRVNIPAPLRAYAQLKKDVTLVGVLDRIEIWDKETWENGNSSDDADMDRIAEHMAELGISI